MIKKRLALYIAILSAFTPAAVFAEPTTTGQTGLINMPDGRVAPDGTLRLGDGYQKPYNTFWGSISLFDRLDLDGRYTSIQGVRGFSDPTEAATYGRYKDKAFDAKLLLLKESKYLPSLAVGEEDFIGTGLFTAPYVAASKQFGPLDVTLGYGRKRIDGAFGGLRYKPAFLKNWAVVAEYDATNYANDPFAAQSGAVNRRRGMAYGLEYRKGWWGGRIAWEKGGPSAMAYVSIPLNVKEYVPPYQEPGPYTQATPLVDEQTWLQVPAYRQRLLTALEAQDFQSIAIQDTDHIVTVSLTNSRISNMSRAVGRAARTILLLAPAETRQIRVVYLVKDQPVATYTFSRLDEMRRYFSGQASGNAVASDVVAHFATNADLPQPSTLAGSTILHKTGVKLLDEGDLIRLRSEDSQQNRLNISPAIALYFNDPSGALHYDTMLLANYDRHLGKGLYLDTTGELTLLQNVSKVTETSNSLLPHVRTDIAEYKRTGRAKIYRAVFNQYFHPAERVYARASAGIYEEMYGGAGGQILYVSSNGDWAADLASDWVKQRDFSGWGFRNYSTVTTLGSLHYRLPFLSGTTATVRVGEFLAKDKGARLELKRRFLSGIEFGAWYTVTNGHDITSPGTPDHPYHDKGIFFSMPLDILSGKDTQTVAPFTISPWTRDVGQMVVSPDDLYERYEKPLILDMAPDQRLYSLGQ